MYDSKSFLQSMIPDLDFNTDSKDSLAPEEQKEISLIVPLSIGAILENIWKMESAFLSVLYLIKVLSLPFRVDYRRRHLLFLAKACA